MEKANNIAGVPPEGKEEEITLEEYLIYSARIGDTDGISLCISERIDLNTHDEHGNTALRNSEPAAWNFMKTLPQNRYGIS